MGSGLQPPSFRFHVCMRECCPVVLFVFLQLQPFNGPGRRDLPVDCLGIMQARRLAVNVSQYPLSSR